MNAAIGSPAGIAMLMRAVRREATEIFDPILTCQSFVILKTLALTSVDTKRLAVSGGPSECMDWTLLLLKIRRHVLCIVYAMRA